MCIWDQILLCGKAVAAGLSGSLSVITSVIDSAVDVVSGILMWWSNRAVKKRNPYCYPQGTVNSLLLKTFLFNVAFSFNRVFTTPGNPGNLLEFNWSSWKFLCKMLKIDRIGFQS